MHVINLNAALGRITEHYSPRVVAAVNDHRVKLAKLKGPFVWHRHEEVDELFLVLDGRLRIEFRDRAVELAPGELLVIPRGVEHRPVADAEVAVLLFEPEGTRNTGDVDLPGSIVDRPLD
jgi:mannose-6-phosphate isomerase-like protein (cupin superfamily)